jgi:hypothetical protein
MKTILLILSLFLITSCDSKENQTTSEEVNDLVGSWWLKSSAVGFRPPEYYDTGDIIWMFNSNNTVDITINVTPNNILPINENGNYPYNIISDNKISINNLVGDYQIDTQILKLSYNATSDGPTYTFQKIEN